MGATDVRPEDAFFAVTRTNSVLGGGTDNLDGLGYVNTLATGANSNTPGAAPANCNGSTPGATVNDLVGQAIKGQEVDSSQNKGSFNVLAFNVTGQDPFTCAVLPAMHTITVGAAPIVFIHSNQGGQLAGLTNANEIQLGQVFSGANPNASAFGLPAGAISAFVREPLSGTMNTTEATVFRHSSAFSTYRQSQEAGVNPSVNNPLNGPSRFRAIGSDREITAVKNAFANHGNDGIGYTFFSYRSLAPIAGSSGYSYIALNSVDPIWHNYVPGTEGIIDPGQPATPGQLPLNTPCGTAASSKAFPCAESTIWSRNTSYLTVGLTTTLYPSYSFPNVRNGSYPSWSVLRLIAGSAWINAQTLVNASQPYAVNAVPDYVPYGVVKAGTPAVVIDPGLQLVRAHYGCTQVTCGLNVLGTAVNPPFNFPEKGRDAGGAILPIGDIKVNLTQDALGTFIYFDTTGVTIPPPDTQPPTAPTGLTATAAGANQINLTWTASTDNVGVAGYMVFRNASRVGTTSSLFYSDTGLSANTTYTYTVSAFDAAGNVSPLSNPAVATTGSVVSQVSPFLWLIQRRGGWIWICEIHKQAVSQDGRECGLHLCRRR